MEKWQRILLMYSTYNFALACIYVVFPFVFPWYVAEILRANAVIVAAAVIYFRITFSYDDFIRFYQDLFGYVPEWFIIAVDLVLHFLPIIMFGGIPKVWWAFLVAYSSLIGWYMLIREHAPKVYGNLMPSDVMDTMVLHFGIVFVMTCSILSIIIGIKKL